MKVGDLVKRAGINPLRVNGLVLEIKVMTNPWLGADTLSAQVLWPNEACEWTEVTWLEKMNEK